MNILVLVILVLASELCHGEEIYAYNNHNQTSISVNVETQEGITFEIGGLSTKKKIYTLRRAIAAQLSGEQGYRRSQRVRVQTYHRHDLLDDESISILRNGDLLKVFVEDIVYGRIGLKAGFFIYLPQNSTIADFLKMFKIKYPNAIPTEGVPDPEVYLEGEKITHNTSISSLNERESSKLDLGLFLEINCYKNIAFRLDDLIFNLVVHGLERFESVASRLAQEIGEHPARVALNAPGHYFNKTINPLRQLRDISFTELDEINVIVSAERHFGYFIQNMYKRDSKDIRIELFSESNTLEDIVDHIRSQHKLIHPIALHLDGEVFYSDNYMHMATNVPKRTGATIIYELTCVFTLKEENGDIFARGTHRCDSSFNESLAFVDPTFPHKLSVDYFSEDGRKRTNFGFRIFNDNILGSSWVDNIELTIRWQPSISFSFNNITKVFKYDAQSSVMVKEVREYYAKEFSYLDNEQEQGLFLLDHVNEDFVDISNYTDSMTLESIYPLRKYERQEVYVLNMTKLILKDKISKLTYTITLPICKDTISMKSKIIQALEKFRIPKGSHLEVLKNDNLKPSSIIHLNNLVFTEEISLQSLEDVRSLIIIRGIT